MKTTLTFVLSLFLWSACNNGITKKAPLQPLEVASSIGEEGETVLVGPMNRANLNTPEFNAWLQPEYDTLKIPEGWIAEHAALAKGLHFKLFLGTWCGDTQRELGGMFKLLDALGVSNEDIEMYGLSEAKDSPKGYEKTYAIINIPTLIFMEEGKEINRIVEFPVESLIEDFSKILKRAPYKDAYADF
ncbi:thioredoxin family protein [Flavobacteriaceae bacterium]|jgi:thiol-disulfide isomerase/thioredoxin|nr:hypothetical protein [Flavobacteriaceae bacterium]MDA7711947.1 thioredoxin family protein [Flavobacteriaceae bacterium]MDA8900398.1 thioredoxin family protein [Flavobacteriaceae bacterium]